jgi:hypothetical protein
MTLYLIAAKAVDLRVHDPASECLGLVLPLPFERFRFEHCDANGAFEFRTRKKGEEAACNR